MVNKDLEFGQEAGCCAPPPHPFPAPHQVQHSEPGVSFKRGQAGNHGKSKHVSVTHCCWHASLVALEDSLLSPPLPLPHDLDGSVEFVSV